nr:unnamed protein product [Digitaria exilis]
MAKLEREEGCQWGEVEEEGGRRGRQAAMDEEASGSGFQPNPRSRVAGLTTEANEVVWGEAAGVAELRDP